MIIKKFIGKIFNTNTYLVGSKNKKNFVCIDPSYGTQDQIIGYLKQSGGKFKYIINTHGHFDHIAENSVLKKSTGAKTLIADDERETIKSQNWIIDKVLNFLDHPDKMMIKKIDNFETDIYLKDGDKIEADDLSFTVMATPGHSRGSICLYLVKEGILFSGDTLFAGTYGRVDLPGSDSKKIMESLKKLSRLPPETIVYPGHEKETTIGDEKEWIEKL